MKIKQFVKLILSNSVFKDFEISRIKTRGVHENIGFRSLNSYAVDVYKNAPRKISFSIYEHFEHVKWAYSDPCQKVMTVTDNVAPCKT